MYKSPYLYIATEGQARQEIDKKITQAGWIIKMKTKKNLPTTLLQRLKKSIIPSMT